MALYGGLCDPQLDRNLLVASAPNQEIKHFTLPRTEIRVRHSRGKCARHGRRQKPPTALNATQGTYERVVRHAFHDIAARTRLKRLMNVLVAFVCSKYYKLGIAMAANDGANCFNAAHAGES